MLPNINKFSNKILDFSESFTKVASRLFELLWCTSWNYFFKEKSSREPVPVLLQRIAELSPPSYSLYTLGTSKNEPANLKEMKAVLESGIKETIFHSAFFSSNGLKDHFRNNAYNRDRCACLFYLPPKRRKNKCHSVWL